MRLPLLYLNLLHASSDGFSSALILFLPFLTTDLHLNLTQVGILGGSLTFMTLVMSLPSGGLSIKLGGMRVLTFAVLLYSLGYIFIGFSKSFSSLFPIFLVSALGYSVFNPIGYGLIARFSEKGNRGKIIGRFSAFGDVGKLILTSFVTIIIAYIGWRNTSFLYGTLAFLFFIFLILSHLKNRSIHKKQGRVEDLPVKTLLRNKRFLLSVLAGMLDYTSSYPLFIFLPFVLLQKGLQSSVLGLVLGLYFVGNLVGKTILGTLTDKGEVKTFVTAEILTAAAVLLMVTSKSPILAVVLAFILGILGKGTTPVTQTMVSNSVEHHKNFEKSIAFYSLLGNITAMSGSVLLGFFSDKVGVNLAFTFTAIMALLAIVPAIFFALERG